MRVPKAGLIAAAAFFALDQFVKWFVVHGPLQLQEGESRTVLPFFDLVNLHNPGVSLGFLKVSPENSWMLVVLTGAIACAVLVWMWREANRIDQFALGMIAGGALGNIVDRVRTGYVQDYAGLKIADHYVFNIFNLADAAITIGVLILLARALLVRDKPKVEQGAEPSEVEKSNA